MTRDPQFMTGIHARIIGKTRRCSCRWLMLGRENRRGFRVRVKRLFKRRSAAGAGLGASEARYLLHLIDSPRSSAGGARTQPFTTARLLETPQVELLYGCWENRGCLFSQFPPTNSAAQSFHVTATSSLTTACFGPQELDLSYKASWSTKGEPYGSHISQSNLACTVASNACSTPFANDFHWWAMACGKK